MGVTEASSVQDAVHETVVHVHLKTYIVVLCCSFIFVAQFVAVAGSGVLSQAIGAAFNQPTKTVWLSSCITIAVALLSLPFSQIADYWGRKWILVLCTFSGALGAIVASRAQTIGTMIAGFALIGLAVGCQSTVAAVASEVLPRRRRPIAQASIHIGNLIGLVVGIAMGSALLRENDINNFRVYMYIVAGIFATATAGLAFAYNPPKRQLQGTLTFSEKLHKLDWVGFGLFAPGLVLFSVALSLSHNPYPFTTPRVLATFLVGVCFLIAFGIHQWRFKKDGFMHHELFRARNFLLGACIVFCEGVSFFAANAYYTFEVSLFAHTDLFHAAVHYLLTFVVSAIATATTALYMVKTKTLRIPTIVGNSTLLIFLICMATSKTSTPAGSYWGFPVIAGIGFGITLPTVFTAIQLSTPAHMISVASAVVFAFRGLGSTVGLAVNNAIFNESLAKSIPRSIAEATLPLGLPASSLGALITAITTSNEAALVSVPGMTPAIALGAAQGLTKAYEVGFRSAWIASACLISPAVILSFFLSDPSSEFTTHIDAPVEQSVIEEQAAAEGLHTAQIEAREHNAKTEDV